MVLRALRGQKLPHFESHSRVIDASPAKVWSTLSDVGAVERWHPMVERSALTDPTRKTGSGSGRTSVLTNKSTLRELVVSQDDAEMVQVVRSTGGTLPFTEAFAVVKVHSVDGGERAIASIDFWFRMKYGALGDLLSRWLIKRRLRVLFARVLEGLDAFVAPPSCKQDAAALA